MERHQNVLALKRYINIKLHYVSGRRMQSEQHPMATDATGADIRLLLLLPKWNARNPWIS